MTSRAAHWLRGSTLIELMVALALGSLLLVGAVKIFVETRAALRAAESLARLHESARFALDILEADVRLAGYWGLAARARAIDGRAGPFGAAPPELTVLNDCGADWAIALDAPVEAADGYRWSCPPYAGRAQPEAHTLAVRRAGPAVGALEDGVLYVRSTHLQFGQLFTAPGLPAGFAAGDASSTHRLAVSGYYVSPTSSLSTPTHSVPSLRVKVLRGGALGPRLLDEEVLPGIEDMRVELGIDTDPPGTRGRGSVNRYVGPDALTDLAGEDPEARARVLAVRIWLRARAERPEQGYVDTNAYQYADRREPPPMDGYRRVVIGKTVYLRNPGGAP